MLTMYGTLCRPPALLTTQSAKLTCTLIAGFLLASSLEEQVFLAVYQALHLYGCAILRTCRGFL